jgi:PPOX class probable F420-dependent enzyme
VNRDGSVQQSVVWYEVRGDQIMMNTKRGRLKDRNLVRTGQASLCVEDGYRYVTIQGTVELINNQAIAQADIERVAVRYHGQEKAARQMAAQFSKEERITIMLTPEHIHGYAFDE